MLGSQKVIAFVSTRDRARALAFYRDTLGLRLTADTPYALVFDAGSTMLRVGIVQELVAVPHTVLGWRVADIRAMAKLLERVGIIALRFAGLEQDEAGIWTSPDGAAVLWFHDPDGNTLSITQFP